jgi:hypothetical protein
MTRLKPDPQYQNNTHWLNSTNGYLVLDKNINGTIENAEELFSNTNNKSVVRSQYCSLAMEPTLGKSGVTLTWAKTVCR